MTEKRFTTKNIINSSYCVWDNDDNPYGNEEVVDLLNGLTAKSKVLYKEIERLKIQNKDLLYSNAKNIELLEKENEQLKTQIKIFEKFLNENNLDIDWESFCTVDECKKDSDDYGCKECKYLGVIWND